MSSVPTKPKEKWTPHLWTGCNFTSWLRLMVKGRFALGAGTPLKLPYYLWLAGASGTISLGHTLLGGIQQAIYGQRIRRTEFREPPIFILGHWRTGTTWLHELMMLDQRYQGPTTLHCMSPHHFLLTEKLFKRYLNALLPEKRPMDNMAVGWERPQEDEFALCMLGAASPYLRIAFPNRRPPIDDAALELDGLSSSELKRWKNLFLHFLKTVAFRDPRRLVLKSPPHTARIATLLELFPDARFIHIMRNPYVVYSSTMKLWKSLDDKHSFQRPTHHDLQEYVLSTFTRMYDRLQSGKQLVPPNRFHELKYEDLVQDPVNQMRQIYENLDLGSFTNIEASLRENVEQSKSYETNKFNLKDHEIQIIQQRWGSVIERYGYELPG
jgi:omega-hydroxy-beta-dihydromenaquinone-9 sulfotransferase